MTPAELKIWEIDLAIRTKRRVEVAEVLDAYVDFSDLMVEAGQLRRIRAAHEWLGRFKQDRGGDLETEEVAA